MKIYKTQSEVIKDINNGVLAIDDDVTFECSISINASIYAYDIYANNIKAYNIDAGNIKAYDIDAGNIDAGNIDAGNISYYAFCLSYNSIKCSSIKARREKHSEPICLGGKLEIKKQEDNVAIEAIKLLEEKGYRIVKK